MNEESTHPAVPQSSGCREEDKLLLKLSLNRTWRQRRWNFKIEKEEMIQFNKHDMNKTRQERYLV